MTFWLISDTHNRHRLLNIPTDIDGVIFAGDMSNGGTPLELRTFLNWFANLPGTKLAIPGNHDRDIETHPLHWREEFWQKGCELLIHDTTELTTDLGTYRVFGSPYVPRFNHSGFMKARNKINRYWQQIPDDTDILITHGPPQGVLDNVERGESVGCSALYKRVQNIRPKYHIFGHVHDCPKAKPLRCLNFGQFKRDGISYNNASADRHGSDTLNQGILIDI